MAGLLSGYSSTIARGVEEEVRREARIGGWELIRTNLPRATGKTMWTCGQQSRNFRCVCTSESLLRKGFPQLQKPGLLPEFCARLGEASARETRS